ncbi:uncharacterized protein N7511_010776 [Penicillium nucicola]|uniref:uncharacterized protein n=1 Tax=Penicillium nucicola TaxID=1850975 RepID=UPI002545BA35|nr:uncharacterized protein N7511_010776 [Penicillium nucicola]KAJ5749080.1 hypothetical protein N7511_010776 [Penicillium nucicola]
MSNMAFKLPTPSARLDNALRYLWKHQPSRPSSRHCGHHQDLGWISESDTWAQLESLHQMLCPRPAIPKLPSDILEDVEAVIAYRNSHNLLTSTKTINPSVTLQKLATSSSLRISCWKGDITTLTDITAIVNAANGQLEGCFRPEHRCIDNVIHSAAGPRLRDACHSLIEAQGHIELVGSAKVTPGFLLPAPWVLHTVGPQLHSRQKPQPHHEAQLASCYKSCLDAAESLPALEDGRKVVAFCCISTGLFAFPSDLAAAIAVDTVVSWYDEHPDTTITDVIFDTFLDKDWSLYQEKVTQLQKPIPRNLTSNPQSSSQLSLQTPGQISSPALTKARNWINEASTLIISAGAGLSASSGLDYTSTALFDKHFHAFTAKGLRRLYDVFGYMDWDSPGQKWGYYFLHLSMVRSWPASPVYDTLRELVDRFPSKYFIRTTNADGFFVKNGFDPELISTPQGQYRFLQCYGKCRPDAVFPSDPLVDAAMPFIDPVTQVLTDSTKIPHCQFCGGEVTLCVRGGHYFNAEPYRAQNMKWNQFLKGLDEESVGQIDGAPKTVILELGVGLNTPGVLRWPNEDLVTDSEDQAFRLIRVGMGASGCVPWELEEQDLAVGVSADVKTALDLLIR